MSDQFTETQFAKFLYKAIDLLQPIQILPCTRNTYNELFVETSVLNIKCDELVYVFCFTYSNKVYMIQVYGVGVIAILLNNMDIKIHVIDLIVVVLIDTNRSY